MTIPAHRLLLLSSFMLKLPILQQKNRPTEWNTPQLSAVALQYDFPAGIR